MLSLGLSRFVAWISPILVALPALAVTVTPTPVTVQEHATQQFTSSQSSTWKTSCGAISPGGLFTAPLYQHHLRGDGNGDGWQRKRDR